MQMEAWALGQPPVDQRRFVGAVVVEDQVDVEVGRHGRLDQIEELPERNRPMAAVGASDDLPTLRVERRKQRGRPVAAIGMRVARGLARLHRQQGLCAVESLNLRFFIDTQHQGMIGRVEIQPDDIAHLLDQQRVGRQREGLRAMRLQAKGPPDAGDRPGTQAGRLRHRPGAPVGRSVRGRLPGADDHGLDGVIGDGPWGTGARFVQQPVHAARHKAGAPAAHHLGRDAQLLGHGLVVQTTRTRQDNARSTSDLGRGARPVGQRVERLLFGCRQYQRNLRATNHRYLLCPRYDWCHKFIYKTSETGH